MKLLFWIEINYEKKWINIFYKENYCHEAV